MFLPVILTIFVLFVLANVIHATSEQAQSNAMWSFGEHLNSGDKFSYRICEYILHIPELPEPCYDATLHFLHLLPGTTGNIWIVATQINHGQKQINTVFHIDSESFEISTDGITIQYAYSIERTLEWIKNYAHKMRPQPLMVGKSWGVVATDAGVPVSLMVSQTDFSLAVNDDFLAYKIGYALTKESHVYVKDGFPFPLEAVIHKPVSGRLEPLEFTVTLTSYSNSGVLCDLPNPVQQVPLYFSTKTGVDMESLDDRKNKPEKSYPQLQEQNDDMISQSTTSIDTAGGIRVNPTVMSYAEFLKIIQNMTGRNISYNMSAHNMAIVDSVNNTVSSIPEKTKNTPNVS